MNWPYGCYSPSSCERNERCMYINCVHEKKNLKDVIRYAKHARDCNQMSDKGEIPAPRLVVDNQ